MGLGGMGNGYTSLNPYVGVQLKLGNATPKTH